MPSNFLSVCSVQNDKMCFVSCYLKGTDLIDKFEQPLIPGDGNYVKYLQKCIFILNGFCAIHCCPGMYHSKICLYARDKHFDSL